MFKIELADKTYRIEFRHCTKLGKHPRLSKRSPIKAITTCVIACDDFISIESAVCASEDNFSRAVGRAISLLKAVDRSPLLKLRHSFIAKYLDTKEEGPFNREMGIKQDRPAISPEEKQRRIKEGEPIRLARRVDPR